MKRAVKKLSEYVIAADQVAATVRIIRGDDFVPIYQLEHATIDRATTALLNSIRKDLLKTTEVSVEEIFDMNIVKNLKARFAQRSSEMIDKLLPGTNPQMKQFLIGSLLHEMLGLGRIELLLNDPNLEEIVVNSSKEPIWVYHKEFGWLKTNIYVATEEQIENYASIIARRVGRQISILKPLLDAHLITQERANATLFPISSHGNTLTIRKSAQKAWTITDFIANKTMTPEIAAFFWLCIQYELNAIVAGGTASGKTALLNTLMPFIQPFHRIISIEDTRELFLPDFLHWVPMVTREANPEGKGEVTMLDLMINSLRMRPDRIVVGEIRRARQAEVLFEAMHTGHSVYSTLHADTAEQAMRRLTHPPIQIPPIMLESLHLLSVQYRDRRLGIRRIYQLAEIIPSGESEKEVTIKPNILYRCKSDGTIVAHNECIRIFDILGMHTGMSERELIEDLGKRMDILEWMTENNINTVNTVGKIIAEYYKDENEVLRVVEKNQSPERLLEEYHQEIAGVKKRASKPVAKTEPKPSEKTPTKPLKTKKKKTSKSKPSGVNE